MIQSRLASLGLALLSVVLVLKGLPAAEEGAWVTDFEAAKATAAKENKDLLLDFTGSDWCGWCIKLRDEVFNKEEFKKGAPKDFVLVELDFPRTKELEANLKAQNDGLAKKYAVQGFPSVILLDSKGRKYAQTGYQEGGPDAYLKHLGELRSKRVARDENLAKAEKAEGAEKAKLLDQAITPLVEGGALKDYLEVAKQIIELDKENKAGLKAKWEGSIRLEEFVNGLEAVKPEEALPKVEAYIKDNKPVGEELQKIMLIKGRVLGMNGDQKGALASFKAAAEAAPDTELGKKIAEFLKQQEAGGEK